MKKLPEGIGFLLIPLGVAVALLVIVLADQHVISWAVGLIAIKAGLALSAVVFLVVCIVFAGHIRSENIADEKRRKFFNKLAKKREVRS